MDEYDIKIRQIKIFRQPEAFLDDILSKVKILEDDDILYAINYCIYFEYRNDTVYVSYNRIYNILILKYKLNMKEIRILLKKKFATFFNNDDIKIQSAQIRFNNIEHYLQIPLAC